MNLAPRKGWTPLMFAVVDGVLQGRHDIVALLLEKGAKVNAVNDEGNTALILMLIVHDAEMSHHLDDLNRYDIAELLLRYGADLYIVNKAGKDAFTLIRARSYFDWTYGLLYSKYNERELESVE